MLLLPKVCHLLLFVAWDLGSRSTESRCPGYEEAHDSASEAAPLGVPFYVWTLKNVQGYCNATSGESMFGMWAPQDGKLVNSENRRLCLRIVS